MSQFNILSACICQFKGMEMEIKEKVHSRDEKIFVMQKRRRKSQWSTFRIFYIKKENLWKFNLECMEKKLSNATKFSVNF